MTDELKTEPRGYINIAKPYLILTGYYTLIAFSTFIIVSYAGIIIHLNVIPVPVYSELEITRPTAEYAIVLGAYVIVLMLLLLLDVGDRDA